MGNPENPVSRGLYALLVAAACLALDAAPARADTLDAYAWPASVPQGDTVSICISSSEPSVLVQIIRYGHYATPYASYANVAADEQAMPDSAYANGCGWTATLRLPIPDSWPSGVYAARIIPSGEARYAPFVVRPRNPGLTSRMLFVLPLATMQAYNSYGGKSLYEFNSMHRQPSSVVSLRRPFVSGAGLSNILDWPVKFIQFMESRGYTMEYCTDTDIHQAPSLLLNYGVMIDVGHDEYWSREMRRAVDAHVARGGSALFFGGNTCWWQIRINGDDQIVCYKDARLDPLTGVADSLVTVNWYKAPVFDPENRMTGVSFRNGGYANFLGNYTAADGFGGFTAYHTDHWAFAGTNLSDGDTLGRSAAIVGYETDGALLDWDEGLPLATGADGTPSNFVVLGVAPATFGHATMGLYESPGLVFDAGATDWSHGLAADSVVQRITLNVVDRALASTAGLGDSMAGACRLPNGECEVTTRTSCELEGGIYSSDGATCIGTTAVDSAGTEHPAAGVQRLVTLPNPSHGCVLIRYLLTQFSPVTIDVLDASGRFVRRVDNESNSAGEHSLAWDGRDAEGNALPAGMYFARIKSRSGITTRKLTLER